MQIAPLIAALARGGPAKAPVAMMPGGPVPGQAKVPGDSPKNDIVPAELSPGEVVLPRSISHDPIASMAFTAAMNRHRQGGGTAPDAGAGKKWGGAHASAVRKEDATRKTRGGGSMQPKASMAKPKLVPRAMARV